MGVPVPTPEVAEAAKFEALTHKSMNVLRYFATQFTTKARSSSSSSFLLFCINTSLAEHRQAVVL